MLLPTVQLNGDDTVGSGTLIFSGENPTNQKVESYVLTSYHVVRNILADTPRAAKDGFDVTVYLPGEKLTVKGKMVASQPEDRRRAGARVHRSQAAERRQRAAAQRSGQVRCGTRSAPSAARWATTRCRATAKSAR
jgi:RNase P/RNase MRP subunit p29